MSEIIETVKQIMNENRRIGASQERIDNARVLMSMVEECLKFGDTHGADTLKEAADRIMGRA